MKQTIVTTNQVIQFYMWQGVKEGQEARYVTLTELPPHGNMKPEEKRFPTTLSHVFFY